MTTTLEVTDADFLETWVNRLRLVPTVSVEEAGAILGLSRTGSYAAVRRNEIPSIRVGRRLLVPTLALLRMLGDDPEM